MSIIEIKNNNLTVGINTLGSELMYVNGAGGTEFLWNGDKNVWENRAPVLFPICGGLKEDKYTYKGKTYTLQKHGFAPSLEFCGTKTSENKAEFVLEDNEITKKQFPFSFRLKISFELEANSLKVTNTVTNPTDSEMYFSIGAHEGYYCPEGIEEYEILFDENQTLNSYILNGNLLENNYINVLNNAKAFPLKYEYFAVDALVFKNVGFKSATLAKKDGTKKVRVTFDGTNYFLLWTKPNANYICLEPWNGIQDIMGSSYDITTKEGIIKLCANESRSFIHTIEFFE